MQGQTKSFISILIFSGLILIVFYFGIKQGELNFKANLVTSERAETVYPSNYTVNDSAKIVEPFSSEFQNDLKSGGKVIIIASVVITGYAKTYADYDMESLSKLRNSNPDKFYADREAAARVLDATKSQVLVHLNKNDYSDYNNFHFTPQFALSVNKKCLEELIGDPLIKEIHENHTINAF